MDQPTPAAQTAESVADGYTLNTIHGYADHVISMVSDMLEARPSDYKAPLDMLWYAIRQIAHGLEQIKRERDFLVGLGPHVKDLRQLDLRRDQCEECGTYAPHGCPYGHGTHSDGREGVDTPSIPSTEDGA